MSQKEDPRPAADKVRQPNSPCSPLQALWATVYHGLQSREVVFSLASTGQMWILVPVCFQR